MLCSSADIQWVPAWSKLVRAITTSASPYACDQSQLVFCSLGFVSCRCHAGYGSDENHACDQSQLVDLQSWCGVMQDMKRRGQWGHIIHISSMAAYRVPSPSDAFYSATKHALRALAEGLRQEVCPVTYSTCQCSRWTTRLPLYGTRKLQDLRSSMLLHLNNSENAGSC